ncbi:MAG TPA: SpvB/TcaC N-terminal domain-containing protein [Vicinamibacterales bacterium]|nr:SpvB/TcaC N-terminal domain-containing protein [Vicinamibacterales bacterium]
MNDRDKPAGAQPSAGARIGTLLTAPPPQADERSGSRPSITLPKGGGAIRGIGEKFSANPATGSGSLTVPIAVSPGRAGFGPQLALSYDSGNGNGVFGFGWTLSLPAISRKTDKGLPRYDDAADSDTFIISGAEDLVRSLIWNGTQWVRDIQPTPTTFRTVFGKRYAIHRYRPRVEGSFSRIERWINPDDPEDTFWRSMTKDNVTTWYGKTAESRVADPANPSRIFSWSICESYDDRGNVVVYRYRRENSDKVDRTQAHERNRTDQTRSAKAYLTHIRYGNRTAYFPDFDAAAPAALPTDWCFEVVFDYGNRDPQTPVPAETGLLWNCRPDPFSAYRSGFEVRTYRRCERVLMFHHFPAEAGILANCLVRSTDFVYAAAPVDASQPPYSFLQSVTQTSYRRDGAGSYASAAMPPLAFRYTEASVDETVRDLDTQSLQNLPYGLDGAHYQWVDLDGEGSSGILTEQGGAWFYKANLSAANERVIDGKTIRVPRFAPVDVVLEQPSTAALSGGGQQLIDLSGDGQLDLVDLSGPTPGFFERTLDERWEPFASFTSLPNIDWQNGNLKFIDLTGDGFPDVLMTADDAFCWHRSLGEEGYGPAQRTPQPRDEEQGPRLIFADGTESIFLADMSGDGLTDLVRIRNGEACYWPNEGYGRFGAKVMMDRAPWLDRREGFDGRRIRLVDIDGSGTADIIYFASGEVHLYFNQSGNAWGARRVLSGFPAIDTISTATAIDLLGSGTTCLVWSSSLAGSARRQMRYIDLMGGQKPHLLAGFSNNLGAETTVVYAPSTKFYVADKLAGRPWVTRLPFPVHVVEQVQTFDAISRNLFVTRYEYHHGHFDGVEREFRGFGRVDQFDTETLAAVSGAAGLPQPVNLDAASTVPPVVTRTWFHTGVFAGGDAVSRQFEHEYYREGDASDGVLSLTPAQQDAMRLADTVPPADILLADNTRLAHRFSGDELREACRALRGSILRQETFARDSSNASDRPYSVSERSYAIEALQPQASNLFGVFFIHARETLDFRYERQIYKVLGDTIAALSALPPARTVADPRVSHAFTLSVDAFGNVLETVAVGYGRRYRDPALTTADQDKQRGTLATYVSNRYTTSVSAADAYRPALIAETSTYELLQIGPAAQQADVTNLFTFDEMRTQVGNASDGAHDIAFEDLQPAALNAGEPYRRLIGRTRTLYRPDDLGAAAGDPRALLPLATHQSRALSGVSCKLAFTPNLIAQAYRRGGVALLPTPAAVLGSVGADGGGYVDLDGDGHWWIPSGRQFYTTAAPAVPLEENEARAHFYMTRRFEDAFGRASTVTYDPHDLLPVSTTDEAGNVIGAINDYRVVAPAVLTDPNGNRSAVAFDLRGFVAATAVMGKTTETVGDLLTAFTLDLTPTEIDAFHDALDPRTVAPPLLGNATTRLVYDLHRFMNTRAAAPGDPSKWQPPFSAIVSRVTHVSDLPAGGSTAVQIAFSYSDGYGREIQKKLQSERGPVVDGGPAVDPRWVGSGWTIFNNKGKPVRQYEPFFSQLAARRHHFEFAPITGVSPIAIYDPVQRMVATLNANKTYQKTVFDPWREETWDVNDTVMMDPSTDTDVAEYFARLPAAAYTPTWFAQRSGGLMGPHEQQAAAKAAAHAATPMRTYSDTLGRTFLTTMDNGGGVRMDARMELDVQGNQRAIVDALGRRAIESVYDLLQNRIAQSSMDSGQTWLLNAATGGAIRAWDSRGHDFTTEYDALRRPIGLFVRGTDAVQSDPRTLPKKVQYEKIEYGESLANASDLNLRGRVIRHSDPSGVLENSGINPATGTLEAYDFKGNQLRSRRTFVDNPEALPDWAIAPPAFTADVFTASTRFDALNRIVAATGPDGSVLTPSYNQANLLEAVDINLRGAAAATSFVTNIDYNAKGQRLRIDLANQASTDYGYDPAIFRLVHLKTERNGVPPAERVVQDLSYVFDPVGNITHIEDAADIQNVVFFDNQRVEPSADFTFDATYRLVEASGRQHLGLAGTVPNAPAATSYADVPRVRRLHPGDGNAVGRYTETYRYDLVGNLELLVHAGTDPASTGWRRTYAYAEPSALEPGRMSNRLSATAVSGSSSVNEPLTYDTRGNIASMIHLQAMRWDFKDQLRQTDRQAIDASDLDGTAHNGERTFYVYDSSGRRVRKTTMSAAGTRLRERFYVGGFEIYREYSGGNVSLERETLHVMDDKQRVAIVETRTIDASAPAGSLPSRTIRYQFANHVGTASLELDGAAAVISYEEYYPFGATSYQAGRTRAEVSLKRYRYLGKERDEESGFGYHVARYYVPWIGRWVSPDPKGLVDGPNPYHYARNNPIAFADPGGQDPDDETAPAESSDAVSVGPFQFRNITGSANLNLDTSFTVNNLFSSDRSLTINTFNAGGTLTLGADTTLTPFGMTGRSTARISLDSLHVDHQFFQASISANGTLAAGPFALDLTADATGTSVIDRNISLSSPGDSLRYTLDNFQGSANVFGRLYLRTGPINRVIGAFSLTADATGTSGVLGFRGYVGLPTLDPGRNINVMWMTGSGTFGPNGYELQGNFNLVLPPVAFATGRFNLDSTHGFSASGHYVGLQFGPLALAPTFDPLATYRPPNIAASPGDAVDTNMSRQLSLPERHPTGPPYTLTTFNPGLSVGYSYLNYSSSGLTVLSAGFAPRASVTTFSVEQPPLPFPLSAVPTIDERLYGHAQSAPAGVYFGVSWYQTFSLP